jgi:hypothetical protein
MNAAQHLGLIVPVSRASQCLITKTAHSNTTMIRSPQVETNQSSFLTLFDDPSPSTAANLVSTANASRPRHDYGLKTPMEVSAPTKQQQPLFPWFDSSHFSQLMAVFPTTSQVSDPNNVMPEAGIPKFVHIFSQDKVLKNNDDDDDISDLNNTDPYDNSFAHPFDAPANYLQSRRQIALLDGDEVGDDDHKNENIDAGAIAAAKRMALAMQTTKTKGWKPRKWEVYRSSSKTALSSSHFEMGTLRHAGQVLYEL